MSSKIEQSITPIYSHDEIEIHIDNVVMRVVRRTNLPWPHEVSAFIPRAEIRRRRYQDGKLVSEDEMILNSLTIVHAPLHPPAGERPPATGPKPPGVAPPFPTGTSIPGPKPPAPEPPAIPPRPPGCQAPKTNELSSPSTHSDVGGEFHVNRLGPKVRIKFGKNK